MKIVVGLGNYTKQYESTRHNCGFMAVDEFCRKQGIEFTKEKFSAFFAMGVIEGEKTVFLKPKTFMNNSGISVRDAADFYDAKSEDILVIYDDMDLEVGQIRVRKNGSAGTHNGMRSIREHLLTDEFPRIRIGIGSHGIIDAADYVLSRFNEDEKEALNQALKNTAEAIDLILLGRINEAMNQFNKKKKPPKRKEEEEDKSER